MQLQPEMLTKLMEASYLTADNASRYRTILRLMYIESESLHYQLYKEDIFELLKQRAAFSTYTMEELLRDLDQLEKWKNLIVTQDPRQPKTIAEFQNRQYRYMLSDVTLEIERMTIQIENLVLQSSSLSTSLFSYLFHSLGQVERVRALPPREALDWWNELQHRFEQMNQSYKDYIRNFYSDKAAAVMQSLEFISYKDSLVEYLQNFILEMQQYRDKIAVVLESTSAEVEAAMLHKVLRGMQETPRVSANLPDEEVLASLQGKWTSLRRWFVREAGEMDECTRILEATNEIIAKILRNASLIVQMSNVGISKKADYQKFFELFNRCETLAAAHVLSAEVFGVHSMRHYACDESRSTESIHSSPYDEPAFTVQVKPRTKAYKERRIPAVVADKKLQKEEARRSHLERLDYERKLVDLYLQGDRIELAEIHQVVPAVVRQTVLQWVATANANDRRRGHTQYGRAFTLRVDGDEGCVLRCEDGALRMPRYTLVFDREERQ